MDVEVLFCLIVDVNFELRNVVFGLGGNDQVVAGPNLELFPLELLVLLLLLGAEKDRSTGQRGSEASEERNALPPG